VNKKKHIKKKKHTTYGHRNVTGLTENQNSWNSKKGVCLIKVNLNSGLVNMHITDNNMEITSPQFYLLFPYFLPV
jgi:hypothetical protein